MFPWSESQEKGQGGGHLDWGKDWGQHSQLKHTMMPIWVLSMKPHVVVLFRQGIQKRFPGHTEK